jgi:hypothetical protein
VRISHLPIASFDHNFPFRIYTVEDQIARTMSTERTLLMLSSFVGGPGLLLGLIAGIEPAVALRAE